MAGANSSVFMNNDTSHLPYLTGENFSEWKDKILLTLGCMDLDLAFRMDEPPIPTDGSLPSEKGAYERWERSNRLSLMLMKSHVGKSIRGSIPRCTKAKEFIEAIEQQYVGSDKALASTLMIKFSSMKHSGGNRGVREHIMEMRDIAAQLNSLEFTFSEPFLVHFILNSLPTEYGPFKISYNTHKEKWSVNELLTMCVQEEGRLKQEKLECAHLATRGKGHFKKKSVQMKKKGKASTSSVADNNTIKCFFCKKKGHVKKECPKYKAWLLKKGINQPMETNEQ